MKLQIALALCSFILTHVAEGKAGSRHNHHTRFDLTAKDRRFLSDFMKLPSSCYDMNEVLCESFSADDMPDTTTFNADVAYELVDYCCCALRKDNPNELYKAALKLREFCGSAPYSKWQASDAEITPPERAVLQYCPNENTPENFFNPSWADLLDVVILGHQSSAFLKCNEPSASSGRITITINQLKEDMYPHVWITLEGVEDDFTFGWSTAHPLTDSSSYDSMTGVEGRFIQGPKSQFNIPLDAPTWSIADINIEKVLELKKEISSEPYDLIQNNCAHVALKLLAEGLGCEATIVPFFSPALMINVLNKVVARCNANGEGISSKLMEMSYSLATKTFSPLIVNLFAFVGAGYLLFMVGKQFYSKARGFEEIPSEI